jgi:hypothetical protein
MGIELHLPNGAAAHYQWLSGVIYIDDTTPIGLQRFLELNTSGGDYDSNYHRVTGAARPGRLRRALRELLTRLFRTNGRTAHEPARLQTIEEATNGLFKDRGFLSGPKPWKNLEEARADLSLRHEFSHYVQDMATGVGYWDELVFRSEFSGLISKYSTKQNWEGLEDLRSQFVDKAFEKFLVLVPPSIEQRRKQERVNFLKDTKIARLGPAGDARHFGIANLLESDAVVEVLIHASDIMEQRTPMSELLFDKELVHLWNPWKMPPNYRVLFEVFRATAFPTMPKLDTREHVARALNYIASMMQQFTDIALAYPAPSFFNGLPEAHRLHFDPVIKFFCLLQAYHEMGDSAGSKVRAAMEEPGSDFQEALLSDSKFSEIYPTRAEIYKGWNDALGPTKDDDDVILRARRASLEGRLREKVIVRRVPLGSSLIDGFWWSNSHQLPRLSFTTDIETGKDQHAAAVELNTRILDTRILELLCIGRTISCPFAGHDCPVEEPICSGGFNSPKPLPREQCILRDRYQFFA